MALKTTSFNALKATTLEGKVVDAPSLVNPAGAVVFLIRRMGCPLCREEALALSGLKPKLDARGIRLIGIAGEHLGHEEFRKDFWKGELYFDVGKKTWYPLMGDGKKPTNTFMGIFSYLCGGVVAKNLKRVNDKGIQGNLKGEGAILGGVWVVGPGSQGIIFEHREKSWGDNVCVSNMEDLDAAIKNVKSPVL
uniref:Peroxiredoxin-like 2A n=1 Tax=Hanusia phi TaxID=3032 RepID=A0A7S0DZW6_9CRYP